MNELEALVVFATFAIFFLAGFLAGRRSARKLIRSTVSEVLNEIERRVFPPGPDDDELRVLKDDEN